jgi:hypothetical protein
MHNSFLHIPKLCKNEKLQDKNSPDCDGWKFGTVFEMLNFRFSEVIHSTEHSSPDENTV